jgi:putative hydrolase of the HAD superfamily
VAVRGVKAVLLDALGTLVELEPPAPRLRVELADRLGVAVGEADCERAIAAEIAYYRKHLDEGRDPESLISLRRRCAETMRAALPPSVQDRLSDLDVVTETLLASLRFHSYDDVPLALAALRNRGHRRVVVSNWDVSLHLVLERVGLASLLDGILTSAEAGVRKPDPAIFERALTMAGVQASDALHVGDSPQEDAAGALAAGIEPVLLRRNGVRAGGGFSRVDGVRSGGEFSGVEGVRTISSLAELPDIVWPMDEGAPIAYQVLDAGVPVYSSEGQLVGTVDHVVAAPSQDIFHGIVMRISSGKGPSAGQRFVAADQIGTLHERGVDLVIGGAAVEDLPEPHGAAPARRILEPGVRPSQWKHLVDMLTGASPWRRDWTDEN